MSQARKSSARYVRRTGAEAGVWESFKLGFGDMTFNPGAVVYRLGSLDDDVRAIGDDMRKAIGKARTR